MPFASHSSFGVLFVASKKCDVSRNNGQLSAVTLHISTFNNICVHAAGRMQKVRGAALALFCSHSLHNYHHHVRGEIIGRFGDGHYTELNQISKLAHSPTQ